MDYAVAVAHDEEAKAEDWDGIEVEEANVPAQAVAPTVLDYLDWGPEKLAGPPAP